ncbi:putative damage-inducible protein DinB [Fontibacillus solani]|uniref:Putative damage-inducible protein DinB n=1 Tax=Fontibacillus solani TaxID=1572857 RepID=A0A7W3XS53_9BACL|nr:DinB family protein [Fontibacillus solani]MBA9086223.1 putative damage-inducible protein DinB [Fontibacillus solani]
MSQLPVNIELYLHTHDQLSQAIEGLSDEALKWKAAPNQWSVTEVLTHLVDHNIVVSFRIREILSDSEARLPAFSQDSWVVGQKANEGPVTDYLNAFKALLHYNSLLFQRLSEEDWAKTGVNWKGDSVSLSALIQSFITHVQTHLAQIERIKQGESASHNSSCSL